MVSDYLEKVYAGFLGMNIGIRLGAPVEPSIWDARTIERFYGDIRGYVKDFRHFAADDDVNGPVLFLRALDDMRHEGMVSPGDVADAWLNYAREGVGLYWWGGYGVSTEHTAYLNLLSGIPAPQSGSIAQNGKTLAEQIGGQIFIDTWGLIAPGDPERAARDARIAASVSHDGEGLSGAAFIAACIAKAFETSSVAEIVRAGYEQIPQDSLYRAVLSAVEAFYHQRPDDWKACRAMLEADWGYDKYPGACHIIPNAGVCALALWYGKGDFARTVEIATMCGWDTDCNAGSVGTILGVAAGLSGIPEHYRAPINDLIVLSGISGYLNILDVPTYCRKLAGIGYRQAGRTPPEDFHTVPEGEIFFDFSLPGSTHGFETDNPSLLKLSHCDEGPLTGAGSLRVLLDRSQRGQGEKVFYKPFYRRGDFDDERYMPVFSPTAFPGQQVQLQVRYERIHGEMVMVTPYVRESLSGREYLMQPLMFKESTPWQTIDFTIPDLEGGLADEIGIRLESGSPMKFFDFGCLYITNFSIRGKADYRLDLTRMGKEFGSILPFSHNHGAWTKEQGGMTAMSLKHAEAVTGNYFMRDVEVTGTVRPLSGESHLVGVRIQGAMRGCYGGLHGQGMAALLLNDRGALHVLAQTPFDWTLDRTYEVKVVAAGDGLALWIDGKRVLKARDDTLKYGMAGYAQYAMGRTWFGEMHIQER